MPLSELKIKNTKAKKSTVTLYDGQGLLMMVKPSGSKLWVSRIWHNGKESRRGLGAWPEVTLKHARELNYELHHSSTTYVKNIKLGALADEWMDRIVKCQRAPLTIKSIELKLKKYIIPAFGTTGIEDITPGMILALCRDIENEGYYETAGRVRRIIAQIYDYAISSDRIQSNPATSITKALQPYKSTHFAALAGSGAISQLMKDIYAYPHKLTRLALVMSALTFCRPSEVRTAEWTEFDLKGRTWIIPMAKTKMRHEHLVPLANQTYELIKEIKDMRLEGKYLFPSTRSTLRPMSPDTVRLALRSMNYDKSEMTAHGFRSMASTTLNEYEWNEDVIEIQLGHGEKNEVRSAYNRASYMQQRTAMMQWWADYLDAMRTGNTPPVKPKITIVV